MGTVTQRGNWERAMENRSVSQQTGGLASMALCADSQYYTIH